MACRDFVSAYIHVVPRARIVVSPNIVQATHAGIKVYLAHGDMSPAKRETGRLTDSAFYPLFTNDNASNLAL